MPPKRKRSGDDEKSNPENGSRKSYAYLKPSVRRIPEKTIKTKWTTLPEPVQDKVRDLFQSLERPVIVRQQNERKRIEAQSALRAVVHKYVYIVSDPLALACVQRSRSVPITHLLTHWNDSLGRRLPRMPFPPITKDSNFDYESALDEHVSPSSTMTRRVELTRCSVH